MDQYLLCIHKEKLYSKNKSVNGIKVSNKITVDGNIMHLSMKKVTELKNNPSDKSDRSVNIYKNT